MLTKEPGRVGILLTLILTSAPGLGDDAQFFHQQVVPLLQKRCYSCHSHQQNAMESGLTLDWKSGWESGGERGAAIVPGYPNASLLIKAVQHIDPALQMPEEKLPDDEIDVLTTWIRNGAYDDRIVQPVSQLPSSDWWSLRPLVRPAVPADSQAGNPIDAFVETRLREHGLQFSPTADRRTLMRRVSCDLIGLPPTPEELQSFVNDPEPEAYERLVERLLASPRYGERWARHWFDTIHFAESHGYEHDIGRDHAWPYRDYVIAAFNNDTNWTRFIEEQLAADQFFPEETHLTAALGFLGAGTFDLSTYTTGPVTFAYLDRDDMLTQTMSAFVSTTVNCARCHVHKFDPVSQEDYYALQAVFSGVVKGDITYDADPDTARQRQQLKSLLAGATQRDPKVLASPEAQALQNHWLTLKQTTAAWIPLQLETFVSSDGSTLTLNDAGILVASGDLPEVDTYTLTGTTTLDHITAFRLDVFPDASLPAQGPGRCENGNLHLSEISLMAFLPGQPSGQRVELARASADFNQTGWGIERAIDGDVKTAWGIHPATGLPHHAVFELKMPLDIPAGTRLVFTLRQLHGGSHLLGTLQVSVTRTPAEHVQAIPADVAAALQIPSESRSDEQQLTIAAFAVREQAVLQMDSLPATSTVYAVGTSVSIPAGNGKFQMATIEAPQVVHLLNRGEIGQPRASVGPGALSSLQHLPGRFDLQPADPESCRRAALARWIAHPENVLTWRSVVNRMWHYHFGRGLCDTPSDFGRMGGLPTHPELLDWLAVWFRDDANGSLKQLHQLIVTSQTYQQQSQDRMPAVDIDRSNRWLWKNNRRRLDADSYRDFTMAVSGTLDLSMGGPAVQQFLQSPGPQSTPELNYRSFDWSTRGSCRRSIYRYVWRGIADPFLDALDFPDLGQLSPERGTSVSSLQALALYNNDFVLYHSQAMADRVRRRQTDVQTQLIEAVRLAWQRDPSPDELREFAAFVESESLEAFCRLLLNSNEFLFVD